MTGLQRKRKFRTMSHPKNGLEEAKVQAVREALAVSDWNIAKAAELLEVTRGTVWRWARKFKLMKPGKVMVRRLVKA